MYELAARPIIDSIPDSNARFYLQFCYLAATRANEACGVGAFSESTRPVGQTKESVSYDLLDGVEVLKILIHILKQKQVKGIPLRTVALPMDDREPWARSIAARIEALDAAQPIVPINRQKLNELMRDYGLYKLAFSLEENQNITRLDNPLRHLRIHDLIGYYHFSIEDIPAYTGHKASSVAKVSRALDRYLHLQWTQYFPKLLRPLPA